jgi:pseudaminic acid synthase
MYAIQFYPGPSKCRTSVYAPETVDIAEKYDFPYYKTASFEIGYTELHERLAKTKKPVFISMGNAEFTTVWKTLQIYRGNKDVYLLKSVPKYPADPSEYNLMTLYDIAKYVQGRVGLSDHSLSVTAAIASVCAGARIVEAHLITNCNGPDESVSRYPQYFSTYVSLIREAEKVMGKCFYGGESIIERRYYPAGRIEIESLDLVRSPVGRSVRVPV